MHCRPEGTADGEWLKLGWAIHETATHPSRQPTLNVRFPELAARATARLQPQLNANMNALRHQRRHYGSYYTMTPKSAQ